MTSKSKLKQFEKYISKLNIDEPDKKEIHDIFLQALENLSDIQLKDLVINLPQVNSEKYSLAKSFYFEDLKAIGEKWIIQSLPNQFVGDLDYLRPITLLPNFETKPIEKKSSESLLERLESLEKKLVALEQENNSIKKILGNLLEDQNNEKEKRLQYIATEIYLDTNNSDNIFKVYSAVTDFIKTIDFIKILDLKEIRGSWYKKFYSKSKEALTSEEVVDRLKKIEYGIEANTILKQQSEIDKNQSEALANIIRSLDKIDNGIVRIGSLLVIKTTNNISKAVNVQVRTLTVLEMYAINQKPSLLRNPESFLDNLANIMIELTNNNRPSEN